MTNLVQFPGLGLSFQLNRVAFTIGGVSIYWYGVCIAVGLCLALVFAFRHSLELWRRPGQHGGRHPYWRSAGHHQRPRLLCSYGTF